MVRRFVAAESSPQRETGSQKFRADFNGLAVCFCALHPHALSHFPNIDFELEVQLRFGQCIYSSSETVKSAVDGLDPTVFNLVLYFLGCIELKIVDSACLNPKCNTVVINAKEDYTASMIMLSSFSFPFARECVRFLRRSFNRCLLV